MVLPTLPTSTINSVMWAVWLVPPLMRYRCTSLPEPLTSPPLRASADTIVAIPLLTDLAGTHKGVPEGQNP